MLPLEPDEMESDFFHDPHFQDYDSGGVQDNLNSHNNCCNDLSLSCCSSDDVCLNNEREKQDDLSVEDIIDLDSSLDSLFPVASPHAANHFNSVTNQSFERKRSLESTSPGSNSFTSESSHEQKSPKKRRGPYQKHGANEILTAKRILLKGLKQDIGTRVLHYYPIDDGDKPPHFGPKHGRAFVAVATEASDPFSVTESEMEVTVWPFKDCKGHCEWECARMAHSTSTTDKPIPGRAYREKSKRHIIVVIYGDPAKHSKGEPRQGDVTNSDVFQAGPDRGV